MQGIPSLPRSLRKGRKEKQHGNGFIFLGVFTKLNLQETDFPYEIVKCGPLHSCFELPFHFLSEELAS